MTSPLILLHSILCVIVISLVLMHSGRDAALSEAFGMGGSSSGSPALVEKYLTRATIVASLPFAPTTHGLDPLPK